jgi:hypothetical protein
VYVGFCWRSEGLFSAASIQDNARALAMSPAIGWGILIAPTLAILWVLGARTFLPPVPPWFKALLAPYFFGTLPGLLLGSGLILLTLRLSTYLRDRYRSLHYGVADFGEFMRALEQPLREQRCRVRFSAIGHSMGTLVLINALRVMSDYFVEADRRRRPDKSLGRTQTFQLDTLVLCAADIPVVMATCDHNNYFLAVLRRFRAVHVFSSDRDVALKWLSLIANWPSEPRYDMAGRKLGNVLLIRGEPPAGRPGDRELWPATRPVWRPFRVYDSDPRPPYPDPEAPQLHFHDCTLSPAMSGTTAGLVIAIVTFGGIMAVASAFAWGMCLLTRQPITPAWWWLAVALVLLSIVGLVCRPWWSLARDHGKLGGILGMFIDWPTALGPLAGSHGWNPHGGYFRFGGEPRRRIAQLVRSHMGSLGDLPEQDAAGIRYRRIDLDA